MREINAKWQEIINGSDVIPLKYFIQIKIGNSIHDLSEAEAGALCSRLNELLDIELYKDRTK